MADYRNDGRRGVGSGTAGDAVYGLGLIGAAIYFFASAESFWDFVLALPKAVLWPVLLVYELFQLVYG